MWRWRCRQSSSLDMVLFVLVYLLVFGEVVLVTPSHPHVHLIPLSPSRTSAAASHHVISEPSGLHQLWNDVIRCLIVLVRDFQVKRSHTNRCVSGGRREDCDEVTVPWRWMGIFLFYRRHNSSMKLGDATDFYLLLKKKKKKKEKNYQKYKNCKMYNVTSLQRKSSLPKRPLHIAL